MALKILFLSHNFYPIIGGIETMSEILAFAFVAAGNEVHLLTHTTDSNSKDFPFLIIRKPSKLRLLREHAWADVVFENNPCLQLSLPGIFFGKPSVVALHTWISKTNEKVSFQNRIKYMWLRRAKKVISCSNIIRERCFPSSVVIGNPYRENIFKIIPEVARTKKFLFVGRLVSDKGADFAIKAFHQIKLKGVQNLSMTIIGDGPEKKPIQDLISNLDLNEYIQLKGALAGTELVECINQHEIILIPSLWDEPFGIVALEGMACGCLPIASNSGGLPDAVGNAGLLFEQGNLDSLISCMEEMMNDESLKKRLHAASLIHLKSHTSASISKCYMNAIKGVFTE